MVGKTKTEIKEKFTEFEYPIHLIGRHVDITEPIKKYAVEKLMKVDRFGARIVEATIILDIQKLMHTVDFIIEVNNYKIKVSGRSENMYASVDEAIAHLEAKLRRYVRRLHEHKAKSVKDLEMTVSVLGPIAPLDDINDQIEEETLKKVEDALAPHEIVKREKMILKTLNQNEAVLKMELSEDDFMIYKGEEDQKLKVIYRRDDGNYGIVEVEK